MVPRPGETAPPLRARSDDGREIDLERLRGRWVVLYFYPKAGAPACTTQARRFEEALPEFERLGAQVIGVSADTEASQAKFRDACGLSFPLLPDGDRTIGKAYGVAGGINGLFGMAERHTFLIGPDGRVARHWRGVNVRQHAREVLETLRGLQAATAGDGSA